jgi:hypothetical protein
MSMDADARAVDAWLTAIGLAGWHGATLEDAAAASGVAAADILRRVGDRTDAVSAFLARIAQESAIAALGGLGTRERLFDGMMRGFDILQAQRPAVLSLWESRDPGVLALVLATAGPGVRRLASAAGVEVGGLRGQVRRAALLGIAIRAFAAWRDDESPDMAATMAALDKLLGQAERAETEGLSPELIGLPGFGVGPGFGVRREGSIFDRLPWRRGPADQVPPPLPGPLPE